MSNHFPLLVRVPHHPEGFDVPLEVILARMERAVGDEAMALVWTQLELWTVSGLTEVIGTARTFCHSMTFPGHCSLFEFTLPLVLTEILPFQ